MDGLVKNEIAHKDSDTKSEISHIFYIFTNL